MGLHSRLKKKTPDEIAHLEFVSQFPCLICWTEGKKHVPSILHHVKEDLGMSERASHFEVIPICEDHHANYGVPGIAFHAGSKIWKWDQLKILDAIWKIGFLSRIIPGDTVPGESYKRPPRRSFPVMINDHLLGLVLLPDSLLRIGDS